jgi:hypothetical protein
VEARARHAPVCACAGLSTACMGVRCEPTSSVVVRLDACIVCAYVVQRILLGVGRRYSLVGRFLLAGVGTCHFGRRHRLCRRPRSAQGRRHNTLSTQPIWPSAHSLGGPGGGLTAVNLGSSLPSAHTHPFSEKGSHIFCFNFFFRCNFLNCLTLNL